MPDPWTLHTKLSGQHDAVVWTDPTDQLVVDVPRLACRTDQLLDNQTSNRVRNLIQADWGVHQLLVVRVLALAAPLRSIGQQPTLPLRPFPLVTTRFAFGLEQAAVPAPRKEDI